MSNHVGVMHVRSSLQVKALSLIFFAMVTQRGKSFSVILSIDGAHITCLTHNRQRNAMLELTGISVISTRAHYEQQGEKRIERLDCYRTLMYELQTCHPGQ